MKTRILTFAVALAILILASEMASAGRLIYRRSVAARWHAARPVIVAPAYPVVAPTTTTILGPNIWIGPRGHLRYVAPVRTIGTPVYIP